MNKFEKISKEQFNKDFGYPDSSVYGQSIYNHISLPKRATTGSAGYDIFAPYDIEILPRQSALIPTGIRVILDNDKFLAIYPRSGLGFKYKMQLWNTIPVIDADYSGSDNEGHIWVKFYNDSPDGKTIKIKSGEAMCQGVIQQYFKTDDDNTDGVRNGGFGSSDKR